MLPQYSANPYALYQKLREQEPVYWDQKVGAWVLTRHNDVVSALRDSKLSAQRFRLDINWFPEQLQNTLKLPINALMRQMLFLDPPDHTRLRSLTAKAFTPRRVEAMRIHIQEVVDKLLDAVAARGQMEVIRDFAYPLPAIVIAEMLGVPPGDRDQFSHWTNDFGSLLDGSVSTPEELIAALSGIADFLHYFQSIIAEHVAAPRDDLMQALLASEERGDTLSEEEILGNCVLLLAAGHGTTTHLIGNGILALLQHSDQLQWLRDNPTTMPNAVSELLRYESPVQSTGRLVKEDVEIGGKHIEAGQAVIPILGAANHDPEAFADPDTCNLRRQENKLLSFGHGIHFCLGAPLAKVEAEVAFSTLLHRFDKLQLLTEKPEWEPGIVFRGLRELQITLQ